MWREKALLLNQLFSTSLRGSAQKMGPPLEISFFPRTNDLQRLMGLSLRVLQTVHSSLRVTFLVVLDFFLKMGLVWPPKPDCLASYLLFPCLKRESLPFLYWETLWTECLVHFLQWVFICLGTWTYQKSIRNTRILGEINGFGWHLPFLYCSIN